MKKWEEYSATLPSGSLAFFLAESEIVISRFHPETEKAIDPINLVNPVENKYYNRSPVGSVRGIKDPFRGFKLFVISIIT